MHQKHKLVWYLTGKQKGRTMNFVKMEACGNDYIYVDCFEQIITEPDNLARKLCQLHYGVGGDGLILIYPGTIGDARMEMYNSDGSRGKMCGNGVRCVAKFLYEERGMYRQEYHIETEDGIKCVRLMIYHGEVTGAILDVKEVTVKERIPEKQYFVQVGNEHLVQLCETLSIKELNSLAEEAKNTFPAGINIELLQIVNAHKLAVYVWERGTGITQSCGTGAIACGAVAAKVAGCVGDVTVIFPGGCMELVLTKTAGMYLSSPVSTVFHGCFRMGTEKIQ